MRPPRKYADREDDDGEWQLDDGDSVELGGKKAPRVDKSGGMAKTAWSGARRGARGGADDMNRRERRQAMSEGGKSGDAEAGKGRREEERPSRGDRGGVRSRFDEEGRGAPRPGRFEEARPSRGGRGGEGRMERSRFADEGRRPGDSRQSRYDDERPERSRFEDIKAERAGAFDGAAREKGFGREERGGRDGPRGGRFDERGGKGGRMGAQRAKEDEVALGGGAPRTMGRRDTARQAPAGGGGPVDLNKVPALKVSKTFMLLGAGVGVSIS